MRTAAARWQESDQAAWYADPFADRRMARRSEARANGALRSSACRAVQAVLIVGAALSIIILIAIGATMILTSSAS